MSDTSFFVEYGKITEELFPKLLSFKEKEDEKGAKMEEVLKKILKIFNKYQEQPQLLDEHLESIVHRLLQPLANGLKVRNGKKNENELAIYEILNCICKVRGYKRVVKLFIHDVELLEELFQELVDSETWQKKYVLFLWLSLIVRNPFDLESIDSSEDHSLPRRMVLEARNSLSSPDKTKEGAAVFIGRLLNRKDMQTKEILGEYLEWAKENFDHSRDPFLKVGICNSLVLLFQNVTDRALMLPYIPIIFDYCMEDDSKQNSLMRKLNMKLVQRIGLIYLKPRSTTWKYVQSTQSLLDNLRNSVTNEEKQTDEEENFDVPEEVEAIIDRIIRGLSDRDTIVRWSAAKGLGRITARLPKDLGEEIVLSFSILTKDESEDTWHGGCLALAELARRGLLLPNHLPDVIPLLIQALHYDIRRGSRSVGAHVRDAACYICWAFSRAYSKEIFKPYIPKLAPSLLKCALFDREVNCRRAASAAFQEHVGRHGSFPHGIEIIQKADFFSLSNRQTAYLEISVFVAQFSEYKLELINHLSDSKISHWDKDVRELASQALGKLFSLAPDHYFNQIIPKLLDQLMTEEDLEPRHGSLISLAEILKNVGLDKIELSDDLQQKLRDIIPFVETKRMYRGRGGEMIRIAICRYIECMSMACITLPKVTMMKTRIGRVMKKSTRLLFQETINENLRHPTGEIVEAALKCFQVFAKEYYSLEYLKFFHEKIMTGFIETLSQDPSPAIRRGYALALGAIPKHLIGDSFDDIMNVLISKISIEVQPDLRDAESRRNAILGLIHLCENAGIGEKGITDQNVSKVFSAFELGVSDYGKDNRGDVGSWVREAAMDSMYRFSILLCESGKHLFTESICSRIVNSLLQQAVEKIDRVRDHASRLIQKFYGHPNIIHRPYEQEFNDIFKEMDTASKKMTVDMNSPEVTFSSYIKLLRHPSLRYSILLGLVVSVGGMSLHVVKHSSQALFDFLQSNPDLREPIGLELTNIMEKNHKLIRLTAPMFKTLTSLIEHDIFESLTAKTSPFLQKLPQLIFKEIYKSRNIQKLLVAVPLVCKLLVFDDPVRTQIYYIVFYLLENGYPKVRKQMADELLDTIQTFEDEVMLDGVEDDNIDEIIERLMNGPWIDKLATVSPFVSDLYPLFNIDKPENIETLISPNISHKE